MLGISRTHVQRTASRRRKPKRSGLFGFGGPTVFLGPRLKNRVPLAFSEEKVIPLKTGGGGSGRGRYQRGLSPSRGAGLAGLGCCLGCLVWYFGGRDYPTTPSSRLSNWAGNVYVVCYKIVWYPACDGNRLLDRGQLLGAICVGNAGGIGTAVVGRLGHHGSRPSGKEDARGSIGRPSRTGRNARQSQPAGSAGSTRPERHHPARKDTGSRRRLGTASRVGSLTSLVS
jgi:hypothetical protein